MPARRPSRRRRHRPTDTLRVAGFRRLFGELQDWRVKMGPGFVLPFVKGLRISAQLIYILREELSPTGLEVDWGYLLDNKDRGSSPECDIIIHHQGYIREWDGSVRPVMHFRFVRQDRAVAVISCKSYANSVDAEYVQKLKSYVKHVFLFAECCAPDKVAALRDKARKAGYAGFGYLYSFDEKSSECVVDERQWISFLNAIASKIGKRVRAK